MNVVFISPNFPPNYFLFCRALRRSGATVLAIGDAPYEDLGAEIRRALTEYYRVDNMLHHDSMLRACGFFTHKYGKIDRIESHTEFWLGTDAQLRQDFNVPGQKPWELEINRHKTGMKQRFREAGIPCADGIKADDHRGVREFAAQKGYPLIFKPDQGVGAGGTFKVNDEWQLQEALNNLPSGYMVETLLTGELLSFDGLTNAEGDVVFCTAHHFSDGIMEIVSERRPMHYYSYRDIPPGLEELGRKVVKAFDVRERFFHSEFFQKDADTYAALEINVRPPGGFTMDMMNYACDIDLYQWWADLVVQKREDFHYERKQHVAHTARRHGMNYQHSHEELADTLGSLLVSHREVPRALSDAIGDCAYYLRSPDLDTLIQGIAMVEKTQH